MPRTRLEFVAELRPQRRDLLGFTLPNTSADVLGTRGQARVIANVGGIRFETIAFPAGDGRHFVLLRAPLRRRLGIVEGMTAQVGIESAPTRPPAPVPDELAVELSASREAKLAWEGLTPAARQIAS